MTTLAPDRTIIIGVTHLLADGQLTPLRKCPSCNFKNIHVDTIVHHIRFTNDKTHHVDLSKVDRDSFRIIASLRTSPYHPYLTKEQMVGSWICCLFCNYMDKIEFDLSLHFLVEHRKELLAIPITRQERIAAKILSGDPFAFLEGPMEYRLDKAVKMAKEKSKSRSGETQ